MESTAAVSYKSWSTEEIAADLCSGWFEFYDSVTGSKDERPFFLNEHGQHVFVPYVPVVYEWADNTLDREVREGNEQALLAWLRNHPEVTVIHIPDYYGGEREGTWQYVKSAMPPEWNRLWYRY